MEDLQRLLKKLRGYAPLREIAERAKMSHTYLGQLEKGTDMRTGKPIKPSAEVLKKLAAAYNYPYEKMLASAGYLKQEKQQPQELLHFLAQPDVMFEGVLLTEEDKEKVRKALELVFRDVK